LDPHQPRRGEDDVTDDDKDARVQQRLVPAAGGDAGEPAGAEHRRLRDDVEPVARPVEVDGARLRQVARRLRERRELGTNSIDSRFGSTAYRRDRGSVADERS
jgi:hypothetical protein